MSLAGAKAILVEDAGSNRAPAPAALADLAFGSLSHASSSIADASGVNVGRHLAFLPADALELDLSDPAQCRFGDYELLERIGEGGMGVVYRAQQASLDREVAVKLLAAGPWASREFVERFLHEAQNAARMQHPNIVTIHEIGTAEELHFFSMQLVRGANLAQKLSSEGPLEPRQAAALMRIVADAVAYAHSLGVLHLDLKPGNVLLDESGVPHVADFGLARRVDHTLRVANNEVSGTPSYMAPEQAGAGALPLTPATDIWGLGAVLYELVTERPPFRGENAQATLKLVCDGAMPRPRRICPTLPLDLEAIILKCLAREPARRYASAAALAEDLTRFCEHRMVHARPLNAAQRAWRWARREPRLAATLLLALGALVAGLVATTHQWRRAEQQRGLAEDNAAISSERLWEGRRDAALRLMADGHGFEALAPLIANVEERERAGKSDTAGVERREMGMIESQGVAMIDRMVVPDAPISAAALSPDGSLLAIALGDLTVRWYDTKTLTERGRVDVSGEPTSDGEERAVRLLRFIDNHRIRVTMDWKDFVVSPDDDDTYLVDLDRTKIVEPPPQFAALSNADYSPDGGYALLHNRQHEMQLWQVVPWRPLSDLVSDVPLGRNRPLGWMLGRNARFVASIGERGSLLDFFDARELRTPQRINLPTDTTVWSWVESHSGALVALGDTAGRVYLLDVATHILRKLPTSNGREVNWLAFSEDDAWLAAARSDGEAFAFDVASGEPLNTGSLQQPFPLQYVAIAHRDRLLVAFGPGDIGPGYPAIWHLPVPGSSGVAATRMLSSPSASDYGFYSAPTSQDAGLLATASVPGEVRLWRLPALSLLPARAARQIPGTLYYDGEHVVDVEYTKLRVASTTGAPPSPWIELSQPVNFAELVDGGRTLVAVSGRELRVLDAATMTLRYAPISLDDSPLRLATDAGGTLAVFTFGNNSASGFEERLQTYDLRSGRPLPGRSSVQGPMREFEVAADGSRLLAVGPVKGTTDVFEPATLRRIGQYRHDPDGPVIAASLASTSEHRQDTLFLVSKGVEKTQFASGEFLVALDPVSGSEREHLRLQGIGPIGVAAASRHVFVAGLLSDTLDPGTPAEHRMEFSSRFDSAALSVIAISHDGRLVAHAFRAEVQLYDTLTGATVGPPLPADLDAMDNLAQLAFSPDDRQLLARSLLNRWALWPIPADTRPIDEIRTDEHLLSAQSRPQQTMVLPSADERAALRARDSGAPRSAEPRPQMSSVRTIAGYPIPARSLSSDPLLLDLTSWYTLAPDSVANYDARVTADMDGLPLGVLRIQSIDYDVRGVAELSWAAYGSRQLGANRLSPALKGIRVPAVPISAVHVLLFASQVMPLSEERAYANVRLHYVNGSEALLPIRTQREVPGYTPDDRPTPLALAFGEIQVLHGDRIQRMISNPRLPNPHPERLIATLDIESIPEFWSEPAIFAVTAEPVISSASSGHKRAHDTLAREKR